MRNSLITFFCICLVAMALRPVGCLAAFGSDTDKPVPEFSRQDASVIATLIPRGKSTKIEIRFDASPGEIKQVQGMDNEVAQSNKVDSKDFRSALFVVDVEGLTPGGETKISIRSQYFTGATRYWAFNEKLSPAWTEAAAKIIPVGNRAYALEVSVKDGGPLDSDGVVNGAVRFVGGPRDSFWGYALGTLFIRFFGIFLVLTILMIGMLASSRIFQFIEGRKKKFIPHQLPVREAPEPVLVSPEMAAAIGLALHLHLGGGGHAPNLSLDSRSAAWSVQGRSIAMDGRSSMFDRTHRIRK